MDDRDPTFDGPRPGPGVIAAGVCWFVGSMSVLEMARPGGSDVIQISALAVVSAAGATMIYFGVVQPLLAALAHERAASAADRRRAVATAELVGAIDRFDDALDGCTDEPRVLDTFRAAALDLVPHGSLTLLPAGPDSGPGTAIALSVEGFGMATVGTHDGPCAALVAATTVCTTSSTAPGACPLVSGGHDGEGSTSWCIPVRSHDFEFGTLHIACEVGSGPDDATLRRLERVSRRCAGRIRHLRAVTAATAVVADPFPRDPVTGLTDRNGVQSAARELITGLRQFSIAVCRVDTTPDPNTTTREVPHGTAPQDALRLVAETLDTTLRPDDVLGRDGDRLIALLSDADSAAAVAAMERTRENLVLHLSSGGEIPFTVSIGVAHSIDADDLDGIIRLADVASHLASERGGNRVRRHDSTNAAHQRSAR